MVFATASFATGSEATGGKFTWTTESAEAKRLLKEIQGRIESFQGGPQNLTLAKQLVVADPDFALGRYYLAAASSADESQKAYDESRELAKRASDGERRFIESMRHVFINQGANFQDSIPELEQLAAEYPNERLVLVILGQLYNGVGDGDKALVAFQKLKQMGPPSPRVEAFLAGDKLLRGDYAGARASYQAIEKELPEGSVPFAIRFGTTFSYLYESQVDAAIASLETFLAQYRAIGADQQFPDVFIHNAIARINLENGRLDAALAAYERGYQSVPGSNLPEDQKQTWLGRLHHGRCRVLAKQGQHEKAWQEAQVVRKMIEDGGQPAEQFWPAYHYLAGYLLLESGKFAEAAEHLELANLQDPFHKLLLARAYEKLGQRAEAKKAYGEITASSWPGIERALAYPEAERRAKSL